MLSLFKKCIDYVSGTCFHFVTASENKILYIIFYTSNSFIQDLLIYICSQPKTNVLDNVKFF